MIPEEHIKLLRVFVGTVRQNPAMLNAQELSFFKEYLESLGATIPSSQTADEPKETTQGSKSSKVEVETEPDEIPYPELDNTGVIENDDSEPLPIITKDGEINEEDSQKADEERDLAASDFAEGKFDSALQHLTAAISFNPNSPLLYAKRANVLLKLLKPTAAISDCNQALKMNPDSAQAYKFRGRANSLLGNWMEAFKDLTLACRIDYDEVAAQWLKDVEPNAKKIQEYERATKRREEEKEYRKLSERRAQRDFEARTEKETQEEDYGNDLTKLLNDPEFAKMMQQDPTVIKKMFECLQNPNKFEEYMKEPAMRDLLAKFKNDMFDSKKDKNSASASDSGTTNKPPTSQPKKAPEPDLD